MIVFMAQRVQGIRPEKTRLRDDGVPVDGSNAHFQLLVVIAKFNAI